MSGLIQWIKENPGKSAAIVAGVGAGACVAAYFLQSCGSKDGGSKGSVATGRVPQRVSAAATALTASGVARKQSSSGSAASVELRKALRSASTPSEKDPNVLVVTRESFDKALIAAGFSTPGMADHIFDVMDVDGSGELDEAELQTVFAVLEGTHEREMVELAFKAIDADDNGRATFSEV